MFRALGKLLYVIFEIIEGVVVLVVTIMNIPSAIIETVVGKTLKGILNFLLGLSDTPEERKQKKLEAKIAKKVEATKKQMTQLEGERL